jgi:hypothetical protein
LQDTEQEGLEEGHLGSVSVEIIYHDPPISGAGGHEGARRKTFELLRVHCV